MNNMITNTITHMEHEALKQAYQENAALLRWITLARKLLPMHEQPARNAVAALYEAQAEMFQALFLPPPVVEESEEQVL